MTTTEKTESYWEAYIDNEFNKNLYLYAEFKMNDYISDVTACHGMPTINKNILLKYIVNYVNKKFNGSKYTVSTMGRKRNDYYIVVSIIQTSEQPREKIE